MSSLSALFPVALLLVVLAVAQTLADHEPSHPPQHLGCHSNEDCGTGATCNPDDHTCTCQGHGKQEVFIPEVMPMCQKIAKVGESCKHRTQCATSSGNLTRCNDKGKCECFDYEKNRDKIILYEGTCYRLTSVGGKCTTGGGGSNQCKASIQPESHVRCELDQGSRDKGTCKCIDGQKCEEKVFKDDKPGAGGASQAAVGISSLISFALVGLVANKVVM